MKNCLIVIDAGTGSGRAVVFDEFGNQLGLHQEEWNHVTESDYPGSMSFDTSKNWRLIANCIGKALDVAGISCKEISAVSSTSMREGIVLYDSAGQELWACANVDSRSEAEVVELKGRGTEFEKGFYAESGQTFALGTLPRLLWVKKNQPKIFERTKTISMINDWVVARLTGEIVVEPTNGGTSGLMSLSTRDWSNELIGLAGIDRDMFPRAVEPGTLVGKVTAAAATETGLVAGTPVIAGGGDVQLGSIGLGVVREGDAAVLGGTFWQQIINIHSNQIDPTMRVRINPSAISGLNQAECISFFVGMAMRWFRDVFCSEEVRIGEKNGKDAYALMEAQAADVPAGSYNVIPIFSDAMNFGSWYHAAPSFLNLSLDPLRSNKAVLFRALEENAAIVSAINLERVREFVNVDLSGPLVFAGGASKGKLWAQILADVTGREIRIPEVREASSLGAAAAAAVGVGLFSDLVEASDAIVRWDHNIEPNIKNKTIYNEATERWKVAYSAQKILVEQGITTTMWSAPGALVK